MSTIRETCSCGASVVINFPHAWEARSESESWRKYHRHEPAQPGLQEEIARLGVPVPLNEDDGSSHVCDDAPSCHDQTVHDTAFGPVQLITDCRVPNNAFYGIHDAFGEHTCTDEKPCDTKQGWRLRS